MKVYRDKDLLELEETIHAAKMLWGNASKAAFEESGDTGSCVMGDGIVVDYLGPRKRKPVQKMIIRSREVAYAQGSSHYERTRNIAIDYLKEKGVDCNYDWGRAD